MLFLICIKNPTQLFAQVPANVQDSLALVDLYNSTNGPSWTDK